jgi:hypothetical protein
LGVPLKSAGTFALGWKQLSLDSLYSERTVSLGYGQWLTPRWAIGAALKQLAHTFATPASVVDDNGNIQNNVPSLFSQNGASKSAFSADAGLLYHLADRQLLGFCIQDINQPNVALDARDEDVVPSTLRWGWAYQSARQLSVTAAMHTRQDPSNTRDYMAAAGLEKGWITRGTGTLIARGALALGTREIRKVSTGFGYRFQAFQWDYAFVFDLSGLDLGATAGTHRFSVNYRFGSEPSPATTPAGIPVGDMPVNILHVPNSSQDGDSSFSLEQNDK